MNVTSKLMSSSKMRTNATIVLGCLIALAACISNSFASQLVEMRLVLDKPSNDAEQMTLDKEALFVQKAVLLDQTDLRVVAVSTNTPLRHPQPGLVFQFTDNGWEHFKKVTRQHNGKCFAIIIDGHIYAAPVIRHKATDIFTQFHNQTFEFHGAFTEQKASELAVKIDNALQK